MENPMKNIHLLVANMELGETEFLFDEGNLTDGYWVHQVGVL
jgi:hypothetical protein